MIEIHQPGFGLAGGFLGTSAREKWPVENGQLHLSGVISNGDREKAGILVIHMDEINVVIRCEGSQSDTLPMKSNPRTC